MILVALPYAALVSIFLFFFAAHSSLKARSSAFLFSLLILGISFVAFLGRPLAGDSLRYYYSFLEIARISSVTDAAYNSTDPLFGVLLWLGSRFGDSHIHLFLT